MERRVGKTASRSTSTSDTRRKPLTGLPVHPLFLAVFPILNLYSRNLREVRPEEVARPLVAAVFGALLCWALLAALTRRPRNSALAASALVLAFFSYGHVANLVPTGLSFLLAPAIAAIALTGVVTALLYRGPLARFTGVLNGVSLLLLLPALYRIGLWLVSGEGGGQATSYRAARNPSQESPAHQAVGLNSARPDIYYIILDAYGREDSLRYFYRFDNSGFARELERRGFYMARRSRSNYDQTGYSLASSLNMRYLDLPSGLASSGNLSETLRQMIDRNSVAAFLKAQGYRYVYIWSGTGQTRIESADVSLGSRGTEEDAPASFGRQVLGLSAMDAAPAWVSEFDRHREFIRTAFRSLASAPDLAGPKFVLAHVSAPHPPFVLRADGEAVDPRGPYVESDGSQLLHRISREAYRTGYVEQAEYINQRILESVDAILRKSRRPPIIILQGDHGSRMNLDWESLERTDLREPFSILNAYLVPARVRTSLYDTISPVNTFRVLFSELFGADLPSVPDLSYFSTVTRPLDFVDVTRRIRAISPADNPAGAAAQ